MPLCPVLAAIACGCTVAVVMEAEARVTTRQIDRDQFNQPVPTCGLGSGFIVDLRGPNLTTPREGRVLTLRPTLKEER